MSPAWLPFWLQSFLTDWCLICGKSDSRIILLKMSLIMNQGHRFSPIAALANIACWPDGARAVINSNTLPQLPELLKSASKWVRVNACILVRNLACHESSLAAILATNSIERLVSTLQHADFRVIQEATYALAILAYWADGAHVIIKSLPQLSELLESANDWVRLNACTLIRNLARHDSSLAAILAANPFERLVSLLSDKNALVMEEAIYALMQASRWLDGAQATVDAMGVYHIPELLKSARDPPTYLLVSGNPDVS
ncbi:armadillo-type protein [Mycena galericulata]|nr:armadillo-type protein [Mycena galericulata]